MTFVRLCFALTLGLMVGGGGAAFISSEAGIAFEETIGLSWLFVARGPIQPPPDVAVITLDNHSAEVLGIPPYPHRWPRAVQAQVILALVRAGVRTIAIDLLLSERTSPAQDTALASAISAAGQVVLLQQHEYQTHTNGLGSDLSYSPIPLLAEAAAAAAPFPLPKVGAGVRQFWSSKNNIPTLPTVALQLQSPLSFQRWIGATAADNHYLNFYGPPGTIPIISAATLLDLTTDQLDLSGKVLFIGVAEINTPDQPDGFYSVFTRRDGVDLSGVEIAATAFANMLTRRVIKPLSGAGSGGMVTAIGLLVGVVAGSLPALISFPSILAGALVYLLVAQIAFNSMDLWLPLATPLLLQVPLALFIGVLGQYMLAHRQHRRMTQALRYYLPEKAATDLSNGSVTAPKDQGETVYAVCLASDLEGFTTIAETMPPAETARYLNSHFAAVAGPIEHYGADVVEFRADGIMCAWTAPEFTPELHQRAILAAIDIAETVPGIRLGMHAGRIFVGHAGAGKRYNYSIIGDIANTASRIEGLNKRLGASLLVSEEVAAQLSKLKIRHRGYFLLKGKRSPLGVVEVITSKACNR